MKVKVYIILSFLMFTSFSIKADEKIEWLPEPSAPSAIHEEPLDTSLPKEEAKEDIVELT